jgi:hypothetical protein
VQLVCNSGGQAIGLVALRVEGAGLALRSPGEIRDDAGSGIA